MANRRTPWWVGLAVAGSLLLSTLDRVSRASEQPAQPIVVVLSFSEQKEDPRSWYGFMPDKEGRIRRQFAGQELILQLADGKLRADTNGDGLIDQKDAPAVEAGDGRQAVRIKVPAKIGGKGVEYPLCIRAQSSGNQHWLLISSAAMLEGKFKTGTIRIYDGNLDGRFGAAGDRLEIISDSTRSPLPGYGLLWSRTIAFERQLYQLDLSIADNRLQLTPYTGPVAEVQIEFAQPVRDAWATLMEANNVQIGRFSAGEAALFVPGKYRLSSLQFRVGANGQDGYLYAYHAPNAAPLELKPGKNTLKLGPPLKMEFTAIQQDDMLTLTAVNITGQGGELYRPNIRETQGDSFAAYIRAGGKEQELTSLGFG